MQDDQLRLGTLGFQHLCRHFQQRFIAGIFIGFKIAAFQELHFIGSFGDTGDSGIVFTDLPLVGEPPRLETGAVSQGDEVVLILRLAIHDAI